MRGFYHAGCNWKNIGPHTLTFNNQHFDIFIHTNLKITNIVQHTGLRRAYEWVFEHVRQSILYSEEASETGIMTAGCIHTFRTNLTLEVAIMDERKKIICECLIYQVVIDAVVEYSDAVLVFVDYSGIYTLFLSSKSQTGIRFDVLWYIWGIYPTNVSFLYYIRVTKWSI